MNRKGYAAEILPWLVRLGILIIALVAIAALVQVYKSRDLDAAKLDRAAYLYRLYYDDSIMYQDPLTKRVYPGIVDFDKFTSGSLDAAFSQQRGDDPSTATDAIASRLILQPGSDCFKRDLVMVYDAERTFFQYEPLANSLQMAGGASMEDVQYPVTIRDKGQDCQGLLNITVVRPNS
jgi:hypothetical protein